MIGNFLIQTYASILRIEKYLEEEEVPEWVSWQSESRLRGSPDSAEPFDERVGFVDASFAWIPPNKDADDTSKKNQEPAVAKPSLMARIKGIFKKAPKAADAEAPAETTEEADEDKPFELENVNIWFKLGGINLVSGPTGSGKSSCESLFFG
jgi:ABC-type multidrug transport system fused ATPase/permease subunit